MTVFAYSVASGASMHVGRVNPLQAYFRDQPVGKWFEIPNTKITDVVTDAGTVNPGIFHDYSGIVLADDDIYCFGGGHGGSLDNTVVKLGLLADWPQFSVFCQPTPVGQRLPASNEDLSFEKLWWGSSPNYKPNPPHTYSSGQHVPSRNSICWFGNFGPYNVGGGSDGRVLEMDLATQKWVQPDAGNYIATSPLNRNTCRMPDGKVYGMASGQTLYSFDGTTFSTFVNNGALNWSGFGALVPDTLRNKIWRLGDYNAGPVVTIAVPSGTVQTLTSSLTGDSGVLSALTTHLGRDTVAACYDDENDRLIIPDCLAGGDFYAIDCETLAVTKESPGVVDGDSVPGTPTSGGIPNGLFGRIHRWRNLVIYAPNANSNICAMRLR